MESTYTVTMRANSLTGMLLGGERKPETGRAYRERKNMHRNSTQTVPELRIIPGTLEL